MFELQELLATLIPISTSGILYLGPETVMPLASIIAAIVGFLLIFWRLLLKPFKKLYQIIMRTDDKSQTGTSEVTDAADEIDNEIPE